MTEARSEVEQAVLRAGEVCGVECGDQEAMYARVSMQQRQGC